MQRLLDCLKQGRKKELEKSESNEYSLVSSVVQMTANTLQMAQETDINSKSFPHNLRDFVNSLDFLGMVIREMLGQKLEENAEFMAFIQNSGEEIKDLINRATDKLGIQEELSPEINSALGIQRPENPSNLR